MCVYVVHMWIIQKKMSCGCLQKTDHVKKQDDHQPPTDAVKRKMTIKIKQ